MTFALPRFVAITDTAAFADPRPVLRGLCEAAKPASVAVLLRDPDMSGGARYRLGLDLAEVCRSTGQQLWVAGRPDLARLLGAAGLHLPVRGLAPSQLRQAGFRGTLSRAYHAGDALEDSELAALSAVLVSPVVAARKGRVSLGLAGFRGVVGELQGRGAHLGIYALGGVRVADVPELLSAGAQGVAAIGLAHAESARDALAALECLR